MTHSRQTIALTTDWQNTVTLTGSFAKLRYNYNSSLCPHSHVETVQRTKPSQTLTTRIKGIIRLWQVHTLVNWGQCVCAENISQHNMTNVATSNNTGGSQSRQPAQTRQEAHLYLPLAVTRLNVDLYLPLSVTM